MIDDVHIWKVAYIGDKSLIGFKDGVDAFLLGNAAARLRRAVFSAIIELLIGRKEEHSGTRQNLGWVVERFLSLCGANALAFQAFASLAAVSVAPTARAQGL